MDVITHKEAYANYEGTEWGKKHEDPGYPDGLRERLQGKSVDEQAKLFAVLENTTFSRSSYGEVDSERAYRRAKRLENLSEFRKVIVGDESGLIEGIMVEGAWGRLVPMGLFDTVTTYYASDDNGSGSNDREDTVTLVCLPPDKEWE
ncbi:MAG: hypothetical protein IJC51_04120 [Eggerthellaceae bacterium]|nr:hypothetical protein [Eggerthellaceae bacterium]